MVNKMVGVGEFVIRFYVFNSGKETDGWIIYMCIQFSPSSGRKMRIDRKKTHIWMDIIMECSVCVWIGIY
jgi:hypothetical protein